MEEKIDRVSTLLTEIHSELHSRWITVKKFEEYVSRLQQANSQNEKDSKISLNVGGTLYTTTKEVLTCEKANNSMLYAVGSGWFTEKWNESEEDTENNCTEIFIDRDGIPFSVILEWLREDQTDAPWLLEQVQGNRFQLNFVRREAEYYGLNGLVDLLKHVNFTTIHNIWIPVSEDSKRLNPNHFELQKSTGKLVPFSFLLLPGLVTRFDVTLTATSQFFFVFMDNNGRIVAQHFQENLDDSVKHVVNIVLDWTDVDSTTNCGWDLPSCVCTLDGDEFELTEGSSNAKSPYLIPTVAVYHVGATVLVENVEIYENICS